MLVQLWLFKPCGHVALGKWFITWKEPQSFGELLWFGLFSKLISRHHPEVSRCCFLKICIFQSSPGDFEASRGVFSNHRSWATPEWLHNLSLPSSANGNPFSLENQENRIPSEQILDSWFPLDYSMSLKQHHHYRREKKMCHTNSVSIQNVLWVCKWFKGMHKMAPLLTC